MKGRLFVALFAAIVAVAASDPVDHRVAVLSPEAKLLLGDMRLIGSQDCENHCDDCTNPNLAFTFDFPDGGYEEYGLPWCRTDDCDSCDVPGLANNGKSLSDVVKSVMAASPRDVAAVVMESHGVLGVNASRSSLQVRGCSDRIAANIPISADLLSYLLDTID